MVSATPNHVAFALILTEHRYPYPIFAVLNTTQRAMLFTFAAGLSTMSSIALKWVYGTVNGYDWMRREAGKPLKKVQ